MQSLVWLPVLVVGWCFLILGNAIDKNGKTQPSFWGSLFFFQMNNKVASTTMPKFIDTFSVDWAEGVDFGLNEWTKIFSSNFRPFVKF